VERKILPHTFQWDIALHVAAALGYFDAEQQRRVRHALATAINPDVALFSGNRPSLREACSAGADGS
jgi:hypothetical protein